MNVAHAVAHQLTDIHFDLNLPTILFMDGLSEHFGEEGSAAYLALLKDWNDAVARRVAQYHQAGNG